MKILASGDNHFCEHIRFAECVRVHEWMVKLARSEGVELFLGAGDLYEGETTPIEREAAAEWVTRMAEDSACVIVKGNHEKPIELAALRRLKTRCPVIVEEAAGVHLIRGFAVGAVAWPDTSYLTAGAASLGQADNDIRAALRAVLQGIGDELQRYDLPRVSVAHFMVDGAIASTNQPLLGMPLNVGLDDLALLRVHLGVMGHIHRAASFDVKEAPHYYTGSPFRTDFGQLEKKTVLLAEFDGSRLVRVEEIETPATRMVHQQWYFGHGGMVAHERFEKVNGAEVRLRYQVSVDRREAGAASAAEMADEMRAAGAVSVKVEEEVRTERRSRAPEVAAALTLADKLEAHWRAISFEPGDRRQALLEKAHKIEEETRDAA